MSNLKDPLTRADILYCIKVLDGLPTPRVSWDSISLPEEIMEEFEDTCKVKDVKKTKA